MDVLNKKIGILGGGQLGKMMILEAKRLGFYVVTLDPSLDCAAHSISDEHIVKPFTDEKAIFELAGKADVITYEIEHINRRCTGETRRCRSYNISVC
jgi:5-(carboxyamino)imidazole ribonucleotide synthase